MHLRSAAVSCLTVPPRAWCGPVSSGHPRFRATTVVPRAEAHAAVRGLLAAEVREVLVFGSGTVWNDLLAAGPVGELHGGRAA